MRWRSSHDAVACASKSPAQLNLDVRLLTFCFLPFLVSFLDFSFFFIYGFYFPEEEKNRGFIFSFDSLICKRN